MTSPKEALEGLLAIINDSKGVDGWHLNGDIAFWSEFEEEVEMAKAAIPVAKLHEQLVELMLDPSKGYDEDGRVSEKVDDLLLQLEALKCNPQK